MPRASRAISLVLVSSALVFAGWGTGDCLHHASGPGGTGGDYGSGYHGSRTGFFWYHSGPYYYGRGAVGGGRPGGVRGGSGLAGPSLRGGFGSFGRGAGA
jgi:hypothetical protein